MLEPLLWIVGTYLLSALCVHAAHAWHRRGSGPAARHFVLIARNEQHRIEWVIRSLLLRSWLKGNPIRLTMIDCGSSDHTRTIMRRLAEKTPFDWFSFGQDRDLDRWMASCRKPDDVVIDLSSCERFSPRLLLT
jgi:hypothetical protein